MDTRKPIGGAEVGRPGEEFSWEVELEKKKSEFEEKYPSKIAEGISPITSSQGSEIVKLLRDIKSELKSQKSTIINDQEELSKIQDELIEELSDEMENSPDRYYAISVSEKKIVDSDSSEWDLLDRLGHEKIIKIGDREYLHDDVFVFCPDEIWFE